MEKSLRAFARFSDGSFPVKPTLSVSAARCQLSQRERQRISWIQLLLAISVGATVLAALAAFGVVRLRAKLRRKRKARH